MILDKMREEYDDLFKTIANAKADIILGKNLNQHFLEAIEIIKAVNVLVDEAQLSDTEVGTYRRLGYEFYRLKDEIIYAMGENH